MLYSDTSICHTGVLNRKMLPKAEEQPETSNIEDPDRPTPPGVVVIPIMPQQPHTDTTALFQSSGLIRNKAALTAIGDSCGCMEYGYTRSPPLCCVMPCCVMPCCVVLSCDVFVLPCCAVLCCAVPWCLHLKTHLACISPFKPAYF